MREAETRALFREVAEAVMDTERTTIQAQIENRNHAEESPTVLMDDAVIPRREVIEQNAPDVEHLDVWTLGR